MDSDRRSLTAFILRAIVLLVLIALVIYVLINRDTINLSTTQDYIHNIFNRNSTDADILAYSPDSTNTFEPYMDGLAVLSTSSFNIIDRTGQNRLSHQVNFTKPVLKVAGRFLLAYDIGGRGLVSVDTFKASSNPITPEGNILIAEINSRGWMLIISDESGSKATASVYNGAGADVYKWYSSEQYLTAAALSDNSEAMVLGGLKQDGAKLKSEILFIRLDMEEPLFRYQVGNSIILDVRITDDGQVLVLTEDSITFLDEEGALTGKYEFESMSLSGYSLSGEDFVALRLSRSGVGDASTLVILDYNAKALANLTTRNILDINSNGKYIGVLTSDYIVVYNNILEELFKSGANAGSNRVLMRKDGSFLLLGSKEANLFKW